MPSAERIKRKVLRQAVEENLDTMRGLPPRSLRRSRRIGYRLRRVAAVALPTTLGAALWLGTSVSAHNQPDESQPAPVLQMAQAASIPVSVSGTAARDPQLSLETLQSSVGTTTPTSVLGLSVRRIVIDPGHGGGSPGTLSDDGLLEKDVALDIALKLRDRLVGDGFDVILTRENDSDLTLSRRAELANESNGDIFVSIHLNALRNRERRGIETYYLGATNEQYLIDMAAAENRDSGYSVADLRGLLDGIYADARHDESRRLAEAVQKTLYSTLRTTSPDLDNRGVKTAPFVVLIATGMPAILAEVSCLSNDDDTKLLRTSEYRQTIADALAEGIRQYAAPPRYATEKGLQQRHGEIR